MLPDEIMQSDMLDILFENRNKTYGAYALRKFYNRRLSIALSTTLFVAAIFAVMQLLHHNKNYSYVKFVTMIDDPHLLNLPVKPPTVLPKPLQQVHFRQTDFQTPVIVTEDKLKPQPTIDDLTHSIISNVTTGGNITADNPIVEPTNNNGTSQSATVTPATTTLEEGPVHIAEVMPEFPGGIDALRKFLLKNIRQPDDLQAGEKIVVLASFVVSKNGSIEDVKIISSGRTDLDKEVLRVIEKMPLWRPGIQNSHEVAVYFNLPVTFLGADEE